MPSAVAPPAGGATAIPGLDSLAAATLLDGLRRLEIAPAELGFEKLFAEDDTFRLEIVERLLGDPLAIPGWQESAVRTVRERAGSPAELTASLAAMAEAPVGRAPQRGHDSDVRSPERWIDLCRAADRDLREAFARLSPGMREAILVQAPAFWKDWETPGSPDPREKGALHRELRAACDSSIALDEKVFLDAAKTVDRGSISAAARSVLEGWGPFAEGIAGASSPPAGAELEGVLGKVRETRETPWGLLVIGGEGDNVYSASALEKIAFLIEPGGNDVYRGRAASAVGGLLRSVSALYDVQGDDVYDAGGASYAIAGALFGVSVLIDRRGNDVYRGGDGSLGAGCFGAGILIDGAGVDTFEGEGFTQGAGAVGIGVLLSGAGGRPPPGPPPEEDRAFARGLVKVPGTGALPVRHDENDTYRCARYGQGFGSTFGVGLLYDRAGNDGYRAGGHYLHAPLRPHDFQSLSQGFSIGFRPRAAGGIGLLVDEEGNDFYDGEVYAQGVSYWYSIGLLFDGGGNDRYHATQYAQGAGVHLAIGSLWDRGGDDQYVSQFGVTQGTAHDLSAGMLLDEGGNDYYVVDGGQGVSLTNSVGIFLDEQGDDLYATLGASQGTLNWARGFSGAALFLDLEGRDRYAREAAGADGAVWSQDLYALGIDLDRDVVLPDEVVPDPVLTREDSLRSVEELFETASLWEVGSAREKVARARKALIAKGPSAFDYVTRSKLHTDDGLEYRAIESLAQAYPDSCARRLLPRLRDRDPRIQANVIRLLGDMKRKEAGGALARMLSEGRQEEHRVRLLEALGKIGDAAAIPAIRPFLRDAGERRRIQAAVALAALADTSSAGRISTLLDDPLLTVRSASSAALVSLGTPAAAPLLARLARPSAQRPLTLRTLGRLAAALEKNPDAASRRVRLSLARFLLAEVQDPARAAAADAESRAAAVEALLGLGIPEIAPAFESRMALEDDPLVRRTYEWGLARAKR